MANGYLTVSGVNSAVRHLLRRYPELCHAETLPEESVEGREIRAFRIAAGNRTDRRGLALIGGVHARELVNPDLLLSLAVKLCQSYTSNSSLAFGPKVYPAGTVKLILETLDLFFVPLVNPDGRAWVQDPNGYPMWRKNRTVNSGSSCKGVDINRNYDFLHSSGIGTSTNPCTDVYRGTGPFSEPETRNVRALLDANPRIRALLDVHSFKEKILHPWGDDVSQTTDPSQNFQNSAYDGVRGDPNDTAYKEYIVAADRDWLVRAGNASADAIKAVRGRVYDVEPAVRLYPTTATSKDYCYSRHLVNSSQAKVYAYTFETGREFQPPYSEALEIIKEVSAGLVQFAIQVMCLADATAAADTVTLAAAETASRLRPLRRLRDDVFAKSPTGREYLALTDAHSGEMIEAIGADPKVRRRAVKALGDLEKALAAGGKARLSRGLVGRLDELADTVASRRGASHGLKRAAKRARKDLPEFADRPIVEALDRLDKNRKPDKPKPGKPQKPEKPKPGKPDKPEKPKPGKPHRSEVPAGTD